MSDYRIDIKVRNNVFLNKLEKAGYGSVGEFCRLNNKSSYASIIGDVINMTLSPYQFDGKWRKPILFCAEKLNCSPDNLFTDVQLNTILFSNKRSVQVKEAEMRFMLERDQKGDLLLEEEIYKEQKISIIEKQLNLLMAAEKTVIKMRFGLGEYSVHTLEECARVIGVTRERVRQIEARALRKLRHPKISNELMLLEGNI